MIICLVSVVVLEGVYIVVTGKLGTELVAVISGLTEPDYGVFDGE